MAAVLPPDPELLTVYLGEGARTTALKALEAWLSEIRPALEIKHIEGGQPLYPYLLSIE